MKNPALDLFLLATSLAQLKDQARVITLFIEGLDNIFPELACGWLAGDTPGQKRRIEVCTRKETFGFVSCSGEAQVEETTWALLHNAGQMLGVILEKLQQEQLLIDQNKALEALAEDRAQLLNKLEDRVARRTAELASANIALAASRLAALNMMEDAIEARQRAEENAAALRREVAERQQAEEALRESEEKFRYVFDNSIIGKSLTSPQGELHVNKAFCDMLGYSVAEFGHKRVQDVTHPADIALTQRMIDSLLTGQQNRARFIKRYLHKNGSIVWVDVSTSLRRDAQGQPLYFITAMVDITERKRTEEALQESENKYRALVQNMPIGVVAHAPDTRILLSNSMASQLLGLTPDQLRGKTAIDPAWQFIREDGRRLLLEEYPVNQALAREEPISNLILGILRPDIEGLTWVQCHAYQERDLDGQLRQVVVTFFDLTARKRAEAEIQNLNAELEQRVVQRTTQLEAANKELEAFAHSVSHDLRAPLRGIDGWSQALLEDYGDQLDARAQTFIHRVRSETQRMGQLIDDLLQLSRLTRAEMRQARVDLSAIAQAVAARLQESAPERSVDFTIEKGLSAQGDPRLLEIALSNLLSNAFKFTGHAPQARIEFGQTDVQGRRAFFVRDNGAGFDMAYAQKLFGAFQRMHRVSEFPGTGIGLATVQRVIHRHGGRVWAEAHVDQGATFYFTLEENS